MKATVTIILASALIFSPYAFRQIDPAELQAMEERLTSMTEEARSCHHRRTQLETRAEALKTSIRTKNLNRKKHQNEVDSLKATQPKLLRQIAECKEQIKVGGWFYLRPQKQLSPSPRQ